MNLENVSQKHLNEMEQLVMNLLDVMRKAKLQNEDVAKSLKEFELELGNIRRERFDAANPEYSSY